MFENGCTNVTDAQHSGCPATVTTMWNEEKQKLIFLLKLICKNRRIMVDQMLGKLNVTVGSIYFVFHNRLKFHKLWATWVPKDLTEKHKLICLDICNWHLAHYHEEDENFLQQKVSGDETWVYYYEPESKWQSMQWKHSTPVVKKLKMQLLAEKLMLTIF